MVLLMPNGFKNGFLKSKFIFEVYFLLFILQLLQSLIQASSQDFSAAQLYLYCLGFIWCHFDFIIVVF